MPFPETCAYRPHGKDPGRSRVSISNYSGNREDLLSFSVDMGTVRRSEDIRVVVSPDDFADVALAMIRADAKAAMRAFLAAAAENIFDHCAESKDP